MHPMVMPQGVEKCLFAKKRDFGLKRVFCGHKQIFLLKSNFFFLNFSGGVKIGFCAKKIEFGLKRAFLPPNFQLG